MSPRPPMLVSRTLRAFPQVGGSPVAITGQRSPGSPDLLRRWKADHEGSNGPALAALGAIDEDSLTDLLLDVFTPPLEQLTQIADQLEETGTLMPRLSWSYAR